MLSENRKQPFIGVRSPWQWLLSVPSSELSSPSEYSTFSIQNVPCCRWQCFSGFFLTIESQTPRGLFSFSTVSVVFSPRWQYTSNSIIFLNIMYMSCENHLGSLHTPQSHSHSSSREGFLRWTTRQITEQLNSPKSNPWVNVSISGSDFDYS